MRPLRFSINVTLDGCYDHTVGIPDEGLHRNAQAYIAGTDAMMLAHVADLEQSGTSRRAYCAEHGLNEQTLAYWIKRKRLDGAADKDGFTAVEVTTAENLELLYPNGVRLLRHTLASALPSLPFGWE